jgi:hypothetical protein
VLKRYEPISQQFYLMSGFNAYYLSVSLLFGSCDLYIYLLHNLNDLMLNEQVLKAHVDQEILIFSCKVTLVEEPCLTCEFFFP